MPLVLHGRHIGTGASKNGNAWTSGQNFKIKDIKLSTRVYIFKQVAVTFEFTGLIKCKNFMILVNISNNPPFAFLCEALVLQPRSGFRTKLKTCESVSMC